MCGFSRALGSSASQDEFIFLFVQPKPNVGRSQARYWTDRRGHSPCIMLLTVRREMRSVTTYLFSEGRAEGTCCDLASGTLDVLRKGLDS